MKHVERQNLLRHQLDVHSSRTSHLCEWYGAFAVFSGTVGSITMLLRGPLISHHIIGQKPIVPRGCAVLILDTQNPSNPCDGLHTTTPPKKHPSPPPLLALRPPPPEAVNAMAAASAGSAPGDGAAGTAPGTAPGRAPAAAAAAAAAAGSVGALHRWTLKGLKGLGSSGVLGGILNHSAIQIWKTSFLVDEAGRLTDRSYITGSPVEILGLSAFIRPKRAWTANDAASC